MQVTASPNQANATVAKTCSSSVSVRRRLHVGEDVGDVGAVDARDELDLSPVDAAVGVPVVDDPLRDGGGVAEVGGQPRLDERGLVEGGRPIRIVSSVTLRVAGGAGAGVGTAYRRNVVGVHTRRRQRSGAAVTPVASSSAPSPPPAPRGAPQGPPYEFCLIVSTEVKAYRSARDMGDGRAIRGSVQPHHGGSLRTRAPRRE